MHESVNEAVEQASRNGVLTAASLMVGGPAATDAIRRARELPQLRVGLHLVLADGRAVLPHAEIPAITDDSGFMDGRMFRRGVRFFVLPHVRRQLEAEMRAQFAAFARTGLKLDHVNMHKHFQVHPTLLSMLLRIGGDYGLSAIRIPAEPLWFASCARRTSTIANTMLKPWISLMQQRLDAVGMFHNDSVFGVAASGAMNEARLLQVVSRLPPGVTEIYLHPATWRPQALSPSMRHYLHADELAALLSPRVRAAMGATGVGRGGFGDARVAQGHALSP